jgi:hypothetical protein
MGRNIRFGVAAAAVLTFVPAWGAEGSDTGKERIDGQSYSHKIEALEDRIARVEAKLETLQEGSGSGEPRSTPDNPTLDQEHRADRFDPQFLDDQRGRP